MNGNRTVNNKMLTPGKTFLVRGKVGFSRITRHTTDDERIAANKMRRYAIDTNYTTITLYDAQILAKNPNDPTNEELYGRDRLYTSKSPNLTGQSFTAISKSQYLPRVFIRKGENRYMEMIPEGELAVGLDVTIQMRVFSSSQNNGVTIDNILINEETPRYYGGNDVSKKALEEMGITLEELPPEQRRRTDTIDAVDDMPEDMGMAMQIDIPDSAQAPEQIPQTINNPQTGFAPISDANNNRNQNIPNNGFGTINQPIQPVSNQPTNPFEYDPASTPNTFGPGENRVY